MRRRLQFLLPLALFAIMAQLFAPFATMHAHARSFDPIASAPLCSDMGGSGKRSHGADHAAMAICCTLCLPGAMASGSVPPMQTLVPPSVDARDVAWNGFIPVTLVFQRTADAQARAPPALA